MQLLLRRAAHRAPDADAPAEVLIAASPDSLARAAWLWDVRVVPAAPGAMSAYDGAGIGRHDVVVRTAQDVVAAEHERVELGTTTTLTRPAAELWIAVVETGEATAGRFALAPGDVLVWEGDDPTTIALEPTGAGAALALVRLSRLDGTSLRWVP